MRELRMEDELRADAGQSVAIGMVAVECAV